MFSVQFFIVGSLGSFFFFFFFCQNRSSIVEEIFANKTTYDKICKKTANKRVVTIEGQQRVRVKRSDRMEDRADGWDQWRTYGEA